jgi:hypothetical protein
VLRKETSTQQVQITSGIDEGDTKSAFRLVYEQRSVSQCRETGARQTAKEQASAWYVSLQKKRKLNAQLSNAE